MRAHLIGLLLIGESGVALRASFIPCLDLVLLLSHCSASALLKNNSISISRRPCSVRNLRAPPISGWLCATMAQRINPA